MSAWGVLLACCEAILMFMGIAWMIERSHSWINRREREAIERIQQEKDDV